MPPVPWTWSPSNGLWKVIRCSKNLLLWTRSLLPSCLFHFSVETVLPVAKGTEALHCLGLEASSHCPCSCFPPSCSVVCLPFSLLDRVRHQLGFTPLCGSLVCRPASDRLPLLAFYYQVSTSTRPCVAFVRKTRILSNSFSPGVFRSEDRIAKY